jgi:hypothetical protein
LLPELLLDDFPTEEELDDDELGFEYEDGFDCRVDELLLALLEGFCLRVGFVTLLRFGFCAREDFVVDFGFRTSGDFSVLPEVLFLVTLPLLVG